MATLVQLRERVRVIRDSVERWKVLGGATFPDAITLGLIVQKQVVFGDEIEAACIPNTGIFLGIFNVACPSGWENVTALNNVFPLGGATYGTTGGAASHTHSYDAIASHTHGPGFSFGLNDSAHSHSYTIRAGTDPITAGGTSYTTGLSSNNTGPGGSHTHGLGGSTGGAGGEATQTSAGGGTLPPYIDVVVCRPVP